MIGIPQAPAPALFHLPFFQKLPPCPVIQLAKLLAQHFGIDPARRAYAAIPGQDLLAQIARIGAQLPLMYTVRGTESPAAARHFDRAPAAQGAAIWPAWQHAHVRPSAFGGSLGAGRQFRLATRSPGRACRR